MAPETHRIDDLRCADQDRETVATILNNAYAEGRLTFDEHAERIAQAYDAKTFGDLNGLTSDLVAQRRPAVTPPPAPLPLAAPEVSLALPGQYTGGNALLTTLKPGRIDTLAANARFDVWLGEVRLDLVDVTFAQRETTIHLGGMMCEVRIRVPEGVDVNTSRLSMVMGETKVDGTRPRPDGIRVNLVGTVVMGEVSVLGPDTTRVKKYEKFVK